VAAQRYYLLVISSSAFGLPWIILSGKSALRNPPNVPVLLSKSFFLSVLAMLGSIPLSNDIVWTGFPKQLLQ